MPGQDLPTRPSVVETLAAALAAVRHTLDTEFAGFAEGLPGGPASAREWAELVGNFPEHRRGSGEFRRLAAAMDERKAPPVRSPGRFALLQTFLATLPRLPGLKVRDPVKTMIAEAGMQVATPSQLHEGYFDLTSEAFYQMAHVASLRWLPAGSLAFETTGFPRSWLLKIHPRSLPDFLAELYGRFGGSGPVFTLHLWMWRPNPFLILPGEYLRALWQTAQTMEDRPEIKGIMADAWYYSPAVKFAFPHLAWLRSFFLEQGAHFTELERAPPDAGFMVGSVRRRQLYQAGQFAPRRTLMLWRRTAVLAWARANPQFGELPPPRTPRPARAPGKPAAASLQSTTPTATRWQEDVGASLPLAERISLWGRRLANEQPKLYILASILIPSGSAALSFAANGFWWAAVPAFLLAVASMWLIQYFAIM